MSRNRTIRAVLFAIVVASLAAGRAARADVALGASFGYTHLSYPDTPGFKNDVLGIPSTEEWGQPGFRVGYLAPSRRWDLNADVGLVHVGHSGPGADETTVELLPQIQANLPRGGGFSPFINGGVGVLHEAALTAYGSSVSATRAVFGGGIGVRTPVSDGHGFLRVELRYDHLPKQVTELSPSDSFTFPATDMISIKFGFDLIVAH